MKKLFTIICLVGTILALARCGASSEKQQETTAETTETGMALEKDDDQIEAELEPEYKEGYLVACYEERSVSGGKSEDVYLKGTILDATNAMLLVQDDSNNTWTVEFTTSCDLVQYNGTECEVYGSNIPGISSISDTPLIEVKKDEYHIVFQDGKVLYPTDMESCNQFQQISIRKEEGDSFSVWVSIDGGSKYHSKPTCSGMDNPKQISEQEAISKGYSKCGRCW